MKVKVVVGSNYGDEGKGLVSGCLARDAILNDREKVLTCFYNGCNQRSHTFEGIARHTLAAGEAYGSDTFYYKTFVVDPIMLWLTKSTPIIDPRCRVIFPCDVLYGQSREKQLKHGSCGFGLFSAVRRAEQMQEPYIVEDFFLPENHAFYQKIQYTDNWYKYQPNEIHNLTNFLRAIKWVKENCRFLRFEDIVNQYDTTIFEGGQGLLLDQTNIGDFPHLTPSSTGAFNIHEDIEKLGIIPELFYVSRSYITRHGRGPMEDECLKQDINSSIIDKTNEPNEWQGSLRFGRINIISLTDRIMKDANYYQCDKNINLVFTHLNYTDNKLETTQGKIEIPNFEFAKIYGSDKKDNLKLL